MNRGHLQPRFSPPGRHQAAAQKRIAKLISLSADIPSSFFIHGSQARDNGELALLVSP